MNAVESLQFFLPELLLLGVGFLILVLDLFLANKKFLGALALIGVAGCFLLMPWVSDGVPLFYGMFELDPFSLFFKIAVLLMITVTILMSLDYKDLPPKQEGEFYAFLLFIAVALILMGSSTNLLMIFLAIESVSLTSYVLAGFLKNNPASNEASLKYLLFGSLASAIMLFGMSILFGMSGTLELHVLRFYVIQGQELALLLIGLTLMMVGFAFKISAAPFHMWAPDVYTGAPTPITALLTVGPKALGFAVLLRVLFSTFIPLQQTWGSLLVTLSILTMTIGNIVAISQNNMKRLLGYSSIAQAGYILIGIAVGNPVGLQGVLIYLIAYALTNLGAFAVVILVSNHAGTDDLEAYAGLSERSPFLALSMTIFLISLAGVPPLAGFIGKFYVFASAIQGRFYLLAIAAAVNSAIAVYYYFRVVKLMYLTKPTEKTPLEKPFPLMSALVISLVGVVVLGIFPLPLIDWATSSINF